MNRASTRPVQARDGAVGMASPAGRDGIGDMDGRAGPGRV